MSAKQILVLGAGVSGLSSGILLLRKGYSVTVWAKDLPPNTTSDKAAASWYPYLSETKDKFIKWGGFTLEFLQKEMLSDPKSGCMKRRIIELFDKPQGDPWWKEAVKEFSHPSNEKMPKGYIDSYEIETVVMDTSIYMNYLLYRFKKLGGVIVQKTVNDIKETLGTGDIIINCTGLGSRDLFNDTALYPSRGQIIKVKLSGFDKIVADNDGPNGLLYIIPRINDIVIGGTAQNGNFSLEVDPKDTEEILRKASNLYPEFKDVEIIEVAVGLRPVRPQVRLEIEKFSGKIVIHNYGHGGSGFTLSWGCAQNVVEIAEGL